MALNPDRPVGQVPSPSTAQAQTPAGGEPQPFVSVTPGDALAVTVKRGDTMFQMARLFGEDRNYDGQVAGSEITDYVAQLKAANGSTALQAGAPIQVPAQGGDFKVTLGIAVQKWLALNPEAGKGQAGDYDWQGMTWTGGPLDSQIVTVPRLDGGSEEFLVSEDMSGENPEQYHVETMADFKQRWKEVTGEEL